MEAVGDLLILLSTLASFALVWVRWRMYRSQKRIVKLLRANAHEREPGPTLEVLATSAGMQSLQIRITNPAGAGNVVTGLFIASGETAFPASSPGNKDIEPPFVIQANDSISGQVFFQTGEKPLEDPELVLIDLDKRRVAQKLR
jgi:hypothetical protein